MCPYCGGRNVLTMVGSFDEDTLFTKRNAKVGELETPEDREKRHEKKKQYTKEVRIVDLFAKKLEFYYAKKKELCRGTRNRDEE